MRIQIFINLLLVVALIALGVTMRSHSVFLQGLGWAP